MNNNTASAYSVSAEGPKKNEFLQQLQYVVNRHADPFQVWASFQDVDADTMAELLGCSRATYDRHVETFGKTIHSPLTAEHVLKFCTRARIHPTDLASSICEPEHACASHIFVAIKFLSRNAHYREDRLFAEAGLNREMQRYKTFCEQYPHVKLIFDEVCEFVRDRRNDRMQFVDTMRAIDGMSGEKTKARNILKSCFIKEARPALISDPRLHIEDYHMDRVGHGQNQAEKLSFIKAKERQHKHDISQSAAFLFGKENVHLVLSTVTGLIKFCNEETNIPDPHRIQLIRDRILKLYPLNHEAIEELKERSIMRDVTPQRLVGTFAEAAFVFFTQKGKTELSEAVALDAKKSLRDFEAWLAAVQMPDFLFQQQLYCNQAAITQPYKRSGQMADLHQRFGQLDRN